MAKFVSAAKRYPWVVATVIVAIVGLALLATPAREVAPWLVGGYALAVAAWEAVGMVRELLKGNAGLDILAVTAITAAVLVGEPWAALVVVLMLTGGAALEDYAENRSKRELTALLRKAPSHATRILDDSASFVDSLRSEGSTEVVPVEDITVGDVLLVRPGELVPVDGTLVSDHAVFDESSLTGESIPVERSAGERVSSGTVNGSVAVILRASAVAADSEYQQIVKLVEQASLSKGQVVRLADKYAVPFTVLSLLIAGAAWALSGEAVRFAEVLVVATPCPLLIAAPVAFLGGMSRAARLGLIVKGGGTLEQLSRVHSIAFDKTGTITSGHPTLEHIITSSSLSEDQVLGLAASAEVYSSHVLADSVVSAARARGLKISEATHAEEIATNGIVAQFVRADGHGEQTVRVGKPSWLQEFAPNTQRVALEPGQLAVYVAVDSEFVGALVMRDQVRPEAREALNDLRNLGIANIIMTTGDTAATAEPIAHALGISKVYSECRPADKVRIVRDLGPRPSMMVGDGLNDAPVLAASDIGFAMGARGATAASESADIVNRFDSLATLPRAVRIGRDTVRVALQSIWLGIIFSIVLMLVAAFGFLPALAGAWLQEVVDLVAILGALRALGPRNEMDAFKIRTPDDSHIFLDRESRAMTSP